jgi:cyanophycinase
MTTRSPAVGNPGLLAGLLVLLLLPSLQAGEFDKPAALHEPVGELSGALVLGGGGPLPEAVRDRFLELAGGKQAHLVVLLAAKEDAGPEVEKAVAFWKEQNVGSVLEMHTLARDRANEEEFLKPLTEATGVWVEGNEVAPVTATYLDTAVHRELHKLLARGGVVGANGAVTAALGSLVVPPGNVPRAGGRGLALLPGFLVEAQALRRNRVEPLLEVLAHHPGFAGLGVDEQTAVVVKGRRLQVLGASYAVTCLSASSSRPAAVKALHAGDPADLIALSRAAVARSQPPFPPEQPPVPEVAKGTLIIGGGGGLSEEVIKRFIAEGGGPDSLFVVVPTALEDPIPAEPGEVKMLKRAGCKNVKLLHTRQRAEADTPEFAGQLKEARGVWFSGGRQWHFVDSYLGTLTGKAFHDVLARGGVIGGSSAGASIQADYMVRGDPLGNLKMMAEGYEQGLGFLKGVAIDQHFFKRNRPADMTDVMAAHPQLLGIGLDEGTAILVQGSVMEVMGKTNVAVYDRRKPLVAGQKDYDVLTPGTRYNLKTRERVEKE